MYEVYLQQIEEMATRANAILDVAIWCAMIGFGLSLYCAVYMILRRLYERKNKKGDS